MEFKDIFKSLREQSGKTQREIADGLGLSDSAIGLWESGVRTPTFKTLQKISEYFNVPTDYLLGKMQIDNSCYLEVEAQQLATFLYEHPEYKVLFEKSKNVSPDNVDRVAKMIDLMNTPT